MGADRCRPQEMRQYRCERTGLFHLVEESAHSPARQWITSSFVWSTRAEIVAGTTTIHWTELPPGVHKKSSCEHDYWTNVRLVEDGLVDFVQLPVSAQEDSGILKPNTGLHREVPIHALETRFDCLLSGSDTV